MHDASIHRDGLAYHVVSCARRKVDRYTRHVLVIADAACRHMLAHDIAQIPRGFIHFRGKCAGGDTRDKNAVFHKPSCESFGQVDDRRLGGLIAVGFLGVQPQTVD